MLLNYGVAQGSWESLDCKEIKPVNPRKYLNIHWRTDAEVAIFGLPDVKSQLTGKESDAGQDWGQEEKGATGDGMAGWHHWLNGHEFEQTQGDGEG